MQLPAQRRARQRFGADAAAPSGADHGGFGKFQRSFLVFDAVPHLSGVMAGLVPAIHVSLVEGPQ
jgi:hypothetical protein